MRILFLAPHPFFQPRGTPIANRFLLRALLDLGHEVTALTYPEGADPEIPGLRVVRVRRLPGTGGVRPGFSWKKVACDVAMLAACRRLLRRERFDLVHAVEESAFIARLLAPRSGVPYVYDMDSSLARQMLDRFAWLRPLAPILHRAEGMAIRGSIGVLAVCPALEARAQRHRPGIFSSTIEDPSLVAPDGRGAAPEVEAIPSPRVLYVGNLEWYQGIDLLLEAFAALPATAPPPHLVLVGGRPEHVRRYAARAESLGVGDRVHLLGPRPPERLGELLRAADVLVSPRTEGDNTPMKIYSYLASGRAIVATDLPTHTQVLDESVARLVPPRPAPFARGLASLLNDAGQRRRLADRAAERARRHYTVEAHAEKVGAFYEGIAARLGRSTGASAAPAVTAAAGRAS